MENVDLQYLCTVIGNLSGVPIRLYDEDKLVFFYSFASLPRDPVILYLEEISKIREHVGYHITEDLYCFGIVNSGTKKLIIGPTRQTTGGDQELRNLAFRLDVPKEETADFLSGMKSITHMPLESIMQILCTVNYVLSGEKLSLEDVTVRDSQQKAFHKESVARQYPEESTPEQDVHNTYALEQTLMTMVRRGDTAALRKWTRSAPAVRGGLLAPEQARQMKNTLIVSATLISRAAIQGGMDIEDSFSLCDDYIRKSELLNAPDQILNLQYHMILEYTKRVERLRQGKNPGKLASDVAKYVQHHLSEAITAENIAKELYLSRPYLSRRLIEETGESLTDFILKEKTEEARNLLRYSDKSIAAISGYLGFSSQSHFSRVFKKYAGLAPGEYREKFDR
ncbi:MAG: helix-turn-helix domain-containing protein [Clostridia bacterium]|nr:helix-turn-helix domain-containing protein [Clostridia bacterium]